GVRNASAPGATTVGGAPRARQVRMRRVRSCSHSRSDLGDVTTRTFMCNLEPLDLIEQLCEYHAGSRIIAAQLHRKKLCAFVVVNGSRRKTPALASGPWEFDGG